MRSSAASRVPRQRRSRSVTASTSGSFGATPNPPCSRSARLTSRATTASTRSTGAARAGVARVAGRRPARQSATAPSRNPCSSGPDRNVAPRMKSPSASSSATLGNPPR